MPSRQLMTQSGHLAGRYVLRVDSLHRGCDTVPADVDRWRRDRSIRHFLPGDNEDLCAWLEVIRVAGDESHDGGVGRYNDFLLAIGSALCDVRFLGKSRDRTNKVE